MDSSLPLSSAARAITKVLKDCRLSGTVSVQHLASRDAVRFEHQPSGFAAEYEGWLPLRDIAPRFAKDLFLHLTRDEREAFDLYQEPHVVRL